MKDIIYSFSKKLLITLKKLFGVETFIILIVAFPTKYSVSVMKHTFKAATSQYGLIFRRCQPARVVDLTVEILSVLAVKIVTFGVKLATS